MSASHQALLEAEANAVFEHGEDFTIDGDPVIYTGIVNSLGYGNTLTESGLEMKRTARLSFLQTEWTPEVGKGVELRGRNYVVSEIFEDTPTLYTVSLVEAHK